MNNDSPFTSFACAGSSNYIGSQGSNSKHYPHPYLDYTSTAVPKSLSELLDWSEYIYINTDVGNIFRRKFNYFMTDVKVEAVDTNANSLDNKSEANWLRMLNRKLNWPVHGALVNDHVAAYGNDFISVVVPFSRFLICKKCSSKVELKWFARDGKNDFAFKDNHFVGRCHSAQCQGRELAKMEIQDIENKDPAQIRIKHWPIREIELYYYIFDDRSDIYWNVPEDYKQQVAEGNLETLATLDMGVLRSIRNKQLFKFHPDRIYHAKMPTLSGLKTRGWGLPPTLSLVRPAWTLQVIRKQIQALGIDFIIPMRIMSPSTKSVSAGMGELTISPNTMINNRDFDRITRQIRTAHRKDPTQIHSVAMPIDYQLIGGEANMLFPTAYQQQAKEDLLDAGDFPVNMYKGDLTLQTAPVGIRLFEAMNRGITSLQNDALDFVADRISEILMWEPVDAMHERVTMVDDIEYAMTKLQLATQGVISMNQGLRAINIDYEDDQKRFRREQREAMEAQTEMQEDMAKSQQSMATMQQATDAGGQAGAGAQPGAPAPGAGAPADPAAAAAPVAGPAMMPTQGYLPPQDINGMTSESAALAEQLVMMDNLSRQRELKVLRDKYPTFHDLVMQAIEAVRSRQSSEGRQMIQQGGM